MVTESGQDRNCPSGTFFCTVSCQSSCQCATAINVTGQSTTNSSVVFGYNHTAVGGATLSTIQGTNSQALIVSSNSSGQNGVFVDLENQQISSLLINIAAQSLNTSGTQSSLFTTTATPTPAVSQTLQFVPFLATGTSVSTSVPATTAIPSSTPATGTGGGSAGTIDLSTFPGQAVWAMLFQANNSASSGSGGVSSNSPGGSNANNFTLSLMPLMANLNLTNLRVEARLNGRLVEARAINTSTGGNASTGQNFSLAMIPGGEWVVDPFFTTDGQLWAVMGLLRPSNVQLFGQPLNFSILNGQCPAGMSLANLSGGGSGNTSTGAGSAVQADQIVIVAPYAFGGRNAAASSQQFLSGMLIAAQNLGFIILNELSESVVSPSTMTPTPQSRRR